MKILSMVTLAVLVLLNFGCAGLSIDLEEKGKSVKIDNTLTEQQKTELTKTTSVKCKLGKNGRPYSNNKLACENDLRNKLAKTGSDIVTIEVAPADPAEFYCNNCIEMSGTGYKSKNTGKASEPETVAAPEFPKELPKPPEVPKISAPSLPSAPSMPSGVSGSGSALSPSTPDTGKTPKNQKPQVKQPQAPKK